VVASAQFVTAFASRHHFNRLGANVEVRTPPQIAAAFLRPLLHINECSPLGNRYELVHRHRAETANAIWQADHTMLDLLILDQAGKPVRPWLTTVMDDYSRAVAGIMVFVGARRSLAQRRPGLVCLRYP
jgi:transposase InsO family protein